MEKLTQNNLFSILNLTVINELVGKSKQNIRVNNINSIKRHSKELDCIFENISDAWFKFKTKHDF